ncbi:hypothetical protein TIFTF001_034389 [Ficus carica]|uniref:Retrotransposon gag domain-containing protein n=1 Tax=Ficus carica TaxID=3494 RepID=A0AA88J532_FICCA|nr:hypothetical protein TIFTF001_034389 [Ficus carica]
MSSQRRLGHLGRLANYGTYRPRLTGGVTRLTGITVDVSSKMKTQAECAREVATPSKGGKGQPKQTGSPQRQLDQLMGQQYRLEQVGAVDPPFTSTIMASPYPARFKMPSMAYYDGSTDADEHLNNYQVHMLIQNANEAALCKSFCLTLTGAARQWYRRLIPGSISSFKQLADAFAAAFLGSKTRKMEASHLFGIKQDESEPLKEFFDCFDKAVVQIKS